MNRTTTEAQRFALKTAAKRLFHTLGGLAAAASCTRLQTSRLALFGDINAPEHHMPVDVVADLEAVAGAPLITEQLAAQRGFVLLPVRVGEGDVADALARVASDSGRTMADALRALREGDLAEPEKLQLVQDLTELVRDAQLALAAIHGPAERFATLIPGVREVQKGAA